MRRAMFTLGIVSALFLVACEGEDDEPVDTTAPSITMEEPGQGEIFDAGSTIHFDALFEDDVALGTYKIDVHDNFDGHSHGREEVAAFTYEESFDLTGTTDDVHEDITVTTDATAGPYHFIVEAIDAAGNTTTFADGSSVELEIWITNEEMPHVHFEDATETEVDEYEGEVGVAPIVVDRCRSKIALT